MTGQGYEIPEDWLAINGLDPATGEYLLPPMPAESLRDRLAGLGTSSVWSDESLAALQNQAGEKAPLPPGVNPAALDEMGWGVIFPQALPSVQVDAILEALSELIDLRRKQTGDLFRIYRGEGDFPGVQPDESAESFLLRLGGQPGSPDFNILPYYLLIVAPPADISFQFQHDLDVQRGVGRLWFESLPAYASYARGVVKNESPNLAGRQSPIGGSQSFSFEPTSSHDQTGQAGQPNLRACFFATANANDRATALSASRLVDPLHDYLQKKMANRGWEVGKVLPAQASKAALSDRLNGKQVPSLLFTASHGLGIPYAETPAEIAEQLRLQGGLVCQDWPGPMSGPIDREMVFAGEDLSAEADLTGMIAFFFACFSAGTPEWDEFAGARSSTRLKLTVAPFLSDLPKKLLGQPGGAALAVIGHVERAWGYSYQWKPPLSLGVNTPQTTRPSAGQLIEKSLAVAEPRTFQYALHELMLGSRLGYAFEHFNQRYAELASLLAYDLAELKFNPLYDAAKTALHWTGAHDARGYAILGDPAVRLGLPSSPSPASSGGLQL